MREHKGALRIQEGNTEVTCRSAPKCAIYKMGYKESEPFYHTAAWRRLRQLIISRQGGMCHDCMEKMRLGLMRKPRRATMVHHIIPYKERPDLALNENNLVALCDRCHEQRHPERRQKNETDGDRPKMRIIKV